MHFFFDVRDYTTFPSTKAMKRLNTHRNTLPIQDFAGQPEYYASHQYFLGAGNAIYILVFDIRRFAGDRAKIEGAETDALYWLNFLGSVQKVQEEARPLVLIATHADCAEASEARPNFKLFYRKVKLHGKERFGLHLRYKVRPFTQSVGGCGQFWNTRFI